MDQLPEHLLDALVAMMTNDETIPQLAVLRIPWRLDSDPESWPHDEHEDRSVARLPVWTIDTKYLLADFASEHLDVMRQCEIDQQEFQLRHPFTHEGLLMEVQTDYCAGFDLNTLRPGEPPLIFETALYRHGGPDPGPFGRVWRYATRGAARAGHAAIVRALVGPGFAR